MPKLVFIGGGNMARSIVGGLINKGASADTITVTDPHEPTLSTIKKNFDVNTASNNLDAVIDATVVVLAVKPNIVEVVCREIGESLPTNTLIVSIAAGVTEPAISRWLGRTTPVVRCMPNTPALLSFGATALFANPVCNEAQSALAEELMQAAGITIWVDEEAQLDTVTSLSGSGPAYFFLLIESMTAAAIAQGLEPSVAETLAIETAYGAASMARLRTESAAQLRENVTSKGGTTAAALASFSKAGFAQMVGRAMKAAEDRAAALGKEFGKV